ncbi:acylneuraminate cytidylyltransferase family protein [Candidatus Thioglobus sp.]|nr:acylneuraminate cytidylyltransferase family protein [Candidatus Thioglobus sp.]
MIDNQMVYAIIPARSGSKGVPNKNIINLEGHPLIAYSIVAARQSKEIDRVIVSTDSEKYAEIACQYGAEVPYIRPKAISGDTATDIEFFKHFVDWSKEKEGFCPEYMVHLRPTTPLRDPKIIDKAILNFVDSKYSALRSAHKMTETSYKTFEVENEKFKMICNLGFNIESTTLPRQAFPTTYNPNGYVDIVRTSQIEKNILHGDCVKAFITKTSYEIDELDDLHYLQYLTKRKSGFIKTLFKNLNFK